MRLKTLTTGLLIGLLAGCSKANQNTPVTSTLESQQAPKSTLTEPNEFDSIPFPQDSCGENLPTDSKAYPVKYYPVFIDYSEDNFQSIKSKYCKDALKKFRKKIGKDAIQVASFLNIETASKFQKFLISKIGTGEVGEPTIIQAKRISEKAASLAQPKLSVEKAARLTYQQTKQLLAKDKNNSKLLDFKIILPTYIPGDFQVDKFEVKNRTYEGSIGEPGYTGHEYTISYRDSRNRCFSIESMFGGSGDGFEQKHTVEVSSSALGKVILSYTDFDQVTSKTSIAFEEGVIWRGKQGYSFNSPGSFNQNCDSITLKEAIKVVESFQYLNP